MANYNPVYHSIWTSKKFEDLKVAEKLTFIYLITNERCQKSGVYSIATKHISCDLDLGRKEIDSVLKTLIEVDLIKYDFKNNIVFIYKYFEFAKGMIKNPYILFKAIARQIELLKTDLWEDFLLENKNILEVKSINDLLIKYQSYNSNNNNNNKDNNKNKEGDSKNDETNEKLEKIYNKLSSGKTKTKIDKVEFNEFYSKYPVKKSKLQAQKKWESLSLDDQKKCIEVLDSKNFKQWVEDQDIKYIKHPSTYLSQGCWDDDLGTQDFLEENKELLKTIQKGELEYRSIFGMLKKLSEDRTAKSFSKQSAENYLKIINQRKLKQSELERIFALLVSYKKGV